MRKETEDHHGMASFGYPESERPICDQALAYHLISSVPAQDSPAAMLGSCCVFSHHPCVGTHGFLQDKAEAVYGVLHSSQPVLGQNWHGDIPCSISFRGQPQDVCLYPEQISRKMDSVGQDELITQMTPFIVQHLHSLTWLLKIPSLPPPKVNKSWQRVPGRNSD